MAWGRSLFHKFAGALHGPRRQVPHGGDQWCGRAWQSRPGCGVHRVPRMIPRPCSGRVRVGGCGGGQAYSRLSVFPCLAASGGGVSNGGRVAVTQMRLIHKQAFHLTLV